MILFFQSIEEWLQNIADAAIAGFFTLVGGLIAGLVSYFVTRINVNHQHEELKARFEREQKAYVDRIRTEQLILYTRHIENYVTSRMKVIQIISKPIGTRMRSLEKAEDLFWTSSVSALHASSYAALFTESKLSPLLHEFEDTFLQYWTDTGNRIKNSNFEISALPEKMNTLHLEIISELDKVRSDFLSLILE